MWFLLPIAGFEMPRRRRRGRRIALVHELPSKGGLLWTGRVFVSRLFTIQGASGYGGRSGNPSRVSLVVVAVQEADSLSHMVTVITYRQMRCMSSRTSSKARATGKVTISRGGLSQGRHVSNCVSPWHFLGGFRPGYVSSGGKTRIGTALSGGAA